MKTKITLFHLFVVLAVVISVAVVVWAVSVGQRLATVDLDEPTLDEATASNVANSSSSSSEVADSSQPIAEKIDMAGIDFDFTPYNNTNLKADTKTAMREVNLPNDIEESIVWMKPKKIVKLGFFGTEVDEGVVGTDTANYRSTDYYLGGLFNVGGKRGAVVYADITCIDEMGCNNEPVSMFVLYNNQVIFLPKHQVRPGDNFWGNYHANLEDDADHNLVAIDSNFTFSYLSYPEEIKHPSDGWVFKYNGLKMNDELYKIDSYKKIYSNAPWGDFYMSDDRRPVVVSVGRDLRVRTYLYTPGIVDKDGLINVVYDDTGKTIMGYRHLGFGGCGEPTVNIIKEGKENVTADLQVVGKTTEGIYVYGLKDSNHRLLKTFYEGIFYPGVEGNISYDEFIAARPAVFWRDSFGQLIMFQLNKFQPTAECGKPVIYLYPEKTTKVKVQLQLSTLTASEPDYGDGWEVMAEPSGQLTEIKSGTKYPYLFWEGLGSGEAEPTNAGFNVRKENVSKFLDEKLAAQGLNQKEIFDFKEFWLPRMQSAPYYFVIFYGTSDMNSIAPLSVSPRPDTVIRVLMDYRAVSAPLNRPEQKLSALPRKGFTVIEWGGVLYK